MGLIEKLNTIKTIKEQIKAKLISYNVATASDNKLSEYEDKIKNITRELMEDSSGNVSITTTGNKLYTKNSDGTYTHKSVTNKIIPSNKVTSVRGWLKNYAQIGTFTIDTDSTTGLSSTDAAKISKDDYEVICYNNGSLYIINKISITYRYYNDPELSTTITGVSYDNGTNYHATYNNSSSTSIIAVYKFTVPQNKKYNVDISLKKGKTTSGSLNSSYIATTIGISEVV